jgi:hypothetical protein
MESQAIFTCVMEKDHEPSASKWEQFKVTRRFIDGESDVLSEGCYYACRSSIDRYFRYLDRQEARYAIYWLNEVSFEVHENQLSNCA